MKPAYLNRRIALLFYACFLGIDHCCITWHTFICLFLFFLFSY